jgi:hypothetical protein
LERLAPDTAILATFIQARAAPFHCPELLLIANVLGATFFCEAPQFGGGTDRLGQAHDESCQKGRPGIERKELPRAVIDQLSSGSAISPTLSSGRSLRLTARVEADERICEERLPVTL